VEAVSGASETEVRIAESLNAREMDELCDATDAAIEDGGGFGWLTPPPRQAMESYYSGVLLVPGRTLFLGILDGVIAGSAQLARPTRNNEAQAASCSLMSAFVAPWARGHGLARQLTEAVEDTARMEGFGLINLDVRESQVAAIHVYETMGYVHWGTHPLYARLADGINVPGRFYYKVLIGEVPEPSVGGNGE
jgi:ribosomal protein S18 acetylase RimI-like enzyme